MDTSETYIKMCRKARGIQRLKPDGSQGEFVYCEREVYQEVDDRPLTPYIWLPRQDQLQEMVNEDWAITFAHFCVWFSKYELILLGDIKSMEQLWLAFVMKEKYGKVWDGEDWIKQS